MFNIVTNEADRADAVLVRAVEPLGGLDIMQNRRKVQTNNRNLTGGPGRVAQALAIGMEHNGISLDSPPIQVLDDGFSLTASQIATGPRIGMNFPGPDAVLPWRYWIAGNPWVSR